jgi:hypothetical protein
VLFLTRKWVDTTDNFVAWTIWQWGMALVPFGALTVAGLGALRLISKRVDREAPDSPTKVASDSPARVAPVDRIVPTSLSATIDPYRRSYISCLVILVPLTLLEVVFSLYFFRDVMPRHLAGATPRLFWLHLLSLASVLAPPFIALGLPWKLHDIVAECTPLTLGDSDSSRRLTDLAVYFFSRWCRLIFSGGYSAGRFD